MDNTTITKTCTVCKKRKPLQEFHKSAAGQLGVAARCKICVARIAREKYLDKRKKKNQIFYNFILP